MPTKAIKPMPAYITLKELSDATHIPPEVLKRLKRQRKIPHISAGYKTHFFDLAKVEKALERLEVRAVA